MADETDRYVAPPELVDVIERIVMRHLQADILSAWDYAEPIAKNIVGVVGREIQRRDQEILRLRAMLADDINTPRAHGSKP